MTVTLVAYAALIGGLAGLMGGLLGIGGGLIMVPLLQSAVGLSMHGAKNTSLAIIGFISIVGTLEASRNNRLDWRLILLCAVFAMLFSALGVRLSDKLTGQGLMRLFGLFLLFMGARYLWLSFLPERQSAAPAPGSVDARSAAPPDAPATEPPAGPDRP